MSHIRFAFVALAVCLVLAGFQNCQSLDSPSGELSASSVDTAPPELYINRAPPAITANTTVTFEFASADTSAIFECSINGGLFDWCSSPKTYSGLTDGDYTVSIRAVDIAGNYSDVGVHAFKVDQLALTVNITTSIPAFTNAATFTIVFAKHNPAIAGTFECKIDFLDWAACVSPLTLNNLGEGEHLVQIRIRDASGGLSSPANLSWRIDRTAPILSINTGPNGNVTIMDTATAPATFTFLAQDIGGSQLRTVTCQLDSGAATNCANQVSYQIQGNGAAHTLTIRATDNANNLTTVTRTFSYTTYYTPPPDPGGE